MTLLGEIRVQVARVVQIIDRRYYQPRKAQIVAMCWNPWPCRFLWFGIFCSVSYYFAFEFADDFPYLHQLRETFLNEQHHRKIQALEGSVNETSQDSGNDQEIFLMAHVFCQRILLQAESMVWIMGTLLRLHRKRFVSIAIIVWMLNPLASLLVSCCGNFALWLSLGCVLTRFFDLTAATYRPAGIPGCVTAFLASTLYWRKFGTLEIFLAVVSAIAGEMAFYNFWQEIKVQTPPLLHKILKWLCLARGDYDPNDKSLRANRIWASVTEFLEPSSTTESTTTGSSKDNPQKEPSSSIPAGGEKDAQQQEADSSLKPYTEPSFQSWVAMVMLWVAIGIQMDGYDLWTL